MNLLFVAGCPRSGTTALLDLLNAHPAVALGRERFKNVSPLSQAHFDLETFLHPTEAETNILMPHHYGFLRDKIESGSVRFLGDKTPGYYRRLPELAQLSPNARLIMIWRDPLRVASSFQFRAQRASGGWSESHDYVNSIKQWNTALARAQKFSLSPAADRFFLLRYEWLFSGDLAQVAGLFSFLGLGLGATVLKKYRSMMRTYKRLRKKPSVLTEAQADYVRESVDPGLAEWATEKSAFDMSQRLQAEGEQRPWQKDFLQDIALSRLEQLVAISTLCSNASATQEKSSHEALISRLTKVLRRAESLTAQAASQQTSFWQRLGKKLDQIRRPNAHWVNQKSLGAQLDELRGEVSDCIRQLADSKENLS